MTELLKNQSFKSKIIEFVKDEEKFEVKPGLEFVLFISQTPCKYFLVLLI